jgi:hypothetical protein
MTANLTAEQRNGLSEGFCKEYPEAPGMFEHLKIWSAVSLHADAETEQNKRGSQNWLGTFLLRSCVVYLADKVLSARSHRCTNLTSRIHQLDIGSRMA